MSDCVAKGKVRPDRSAKIMRALERHRPELRDRLQDMARKKR